MGAEIELKLELPEGGAERLLEEDWFGRDCSTQRQSSVYFDTREKELRERGYTLRVRDAGNRFIQTVKSLDGGAGLFQRGEWEYEIGSTEPEAEELAHTPLAGLDVACLVPTVRSDVDRTVCRLHEAGTELEVAIDCGVMSAAKHEAAVRELEIELIKGEAAAAIGVARRIAHAIPVKLGVLSKAERGFALADGKLGKLAKAEGVVVSPEMSVAEGFATIVSACLRHFRLNEQLIVDKRQAEPLHQARVAMRRLRSAMSLFRSAIGDAEFARLRDELRWLTRELGDARNLDVFLQRDLKPGQRKRIEARRIAAYDRVIEALESLPVRMLMLDLVNWSMLGEWRNRANAQRALGPYVGRRIDRLWGRIMHHDRIGGLHEEERHRLRIEIKKLRYALEFTEALYARHQERQKRFANAVEDTQEALGHLNDAAVARTLVEPGVWPIEPVRLDDSQRALIRDAEDAMHHLRRIGPYWREE
jgi:triphosphatase